MLSPIFVLYSVKLGGNKILFPAKRKNSVWKLVTVPRTRSRSCCTGVVRQKYIKIDYYLLLVVSVSTHTFKYALKSKKLTNDYIYPHLFILYIQPLYLRTFVVMFNLNAFPDISDLFHSTYRGLS